jgi:hypothetical protein
VVTVAVVVAVVVAVAVVMEATELSLFISKEKIKST